MFAEPPTADDGPEKPGKGRPRPGSSELAAAALAAGNTAKDAAAAARCHVRTVRKWQAKPEFQARVSELRAEAVGRSLGRLSDGMTAAADALRALVAHKDPHVRFKAARAVLELGVRFREAVELEQRLRDLEAKLGAPTP